MFVHASRAFVQVANYCVTKLAELNVPLSTHAVGLTPESQLPPANGHQYLELTCNGFVSGMAAAHLGLRARAGGAGGGGGGGFSTSCTAMGAPAA